MAGVSTVPAVLDALVELTRLALPNVQVIDGQPVRDLERDLVCIGFTGEPGEVAVSDTRTREQMSTAPDKESYEVTCVASSWRGKETDPKAVRDGVYALVDALNDELMKTPTLGVGGVLRARLSTLGYAPMQSNDGASATVQFVIAVTAFTR